MHRPGATTDLQRPLVMWPDRVGETHRIPGDLRRAARHARRVARAALVARGLSGSRRARRLRRRLARRRPANPTRSYRVRVVAASFPAKQSIAKPERMILAVRNTGVRDDPEHRDHRRLLQLRLELRRAGRQQAADLGDRTWARRESQPAGRNAGSQHAGSGAQTSYLNTWALGALAPPPDGDVRVAGGAGEGRPLHGPLHRRRRARRQGPGAARTRPAGDGHLPRARRGRVPAAKHVDPKTGKVVEGAYPTPVGAGRPRPFGRVSKNPVRRFRQTVIRFAPRLRLRLTRLRARRRAHCRTRPFLVGGIRPRSCPGPASRT